jgi:hypothetical protein
MIGTLNEGPLHRDIKAHYRARLEAAAQPVQEEVPVGTFVADLLAGNQIVEVQTGKLGKLRRKLDALLDGYRLLVVYPVAVHRYLVKLSPDADGTFQRRRSPRHGSRLTLLDELVSIPDLLSHPNFELDVLLIEEETIREYVPKARRGRGGWQTRERRLVQVLDTERVAGLADLWSWLPEDPAEPFGTAELAQCLSCSREVARKYAYCLREGGALTLAGKTGNSLLYRRAAPGAER